MHRFALAVGSSLYKTIRLRIPISGLKVLKGDYCKVCAIMNLCGFIHSLTVLTGK